MRPEEFNPAAIRQQIHRTDQLVIRLCRDLTSGIEETVSNSAVKAHIYAKIADAMMHASHYAFVDMVASAEEYLHPPAASSEPRR